MRRTLRNENKKQSLKIYIIFLNSKVLDIGTDSIIYGKDWTTVIHKNGDETCFPNSSISYIKRKKL